MGAGDGLGFLLWIFFVRQETVEIHVLVRQESELFQVKGCFSEERKFLVELLEIPAAKFRDFVVSEAESLNLIRGQVVSDDAGDFLQLQLLRGEIARVSRDDYVFPVDDDGNLETELGNARGPYAKELNRI